MQSLVCVLFLIFLQRALVVTGSALLLVLLYSIYFAKMALLIVGLDTTALKI